MIEMIRCIFHILSSVAKQLENSSKKQGHMTCFAQLCCSFEAYRYTKRCKIDQKFSYWKLILSICFGIYTLLIFHGSYLTMKKSEKDSLAENTHYMVYTSFQYIWRGKSSCHVLQTVNLETCSYCSFEC